MRFPFILRRLGTYFRDGDGAPEQVANDGAFLRENARHSVPTITWVGHATMLVQVEHVTFLTDPTWSNRPSPVPLIGPRRYVAPGLKMEDLPQPHEDKDDEYLPPALPLPFRFEHTTTTVNDLIEALEKTLMERSTTRRPNLPILPLPIPDFLDAEQYLLEIEGRADNLFEEIQWRFESKGEVRLTELVYGQDWLEVVRIFMMLLFLAQRMKIGLEQSEEEFDVFITLKEESEHLD